MAVVFMNDDEDVLRLFCRLVDDIGRCRLIRSAHASPSWQFKLGTDAVGNAVIDGPSFDWEDFRSFLTLFRRLIAHDEKTNLPNVMKVITRIAPEEKRAGLRETRKHVERHIRADEGPLQVGGHDRDGVKRMFNPREIVDVVMNADVFHGDLHRQREWDAVQVMKPMIVPLVLEYAAVVLHAAFIYRDNIFLRGWLNGLQPSVVEVLPRDGSLDQLQHVTVESA